MNPPSPQSEHRTNWRANWLSAIHELADLELQHKTWLNPASGNPHFTFVEFVECYFDDLALRNDGGGYPARLVEGLVSGDEVAAVSRFHAEFDRYEPPNGDHYDHQAILNDPAWCGVVVAAKEAQIALACIILDPEELTHLLQPSQ